MHKIRYSVGILIDNVGRLLLCSEHIAPTNAKLIYSISVERYLSTEEAPETAIMRQLARQIGINKHNFTKVAKIDEMEYINTGKDVLVRNVYIYAYQIKSLITLRIDKPNNNPIRFITFSNLQNMVSDKSIHISACAKKVMCFLEIRQNNVFKDIFT